MAILHAGVSPEEAEIRQKYSDRSRRQWRRSLGAFVLGGAMILSSIPYSIVSKRAKKAEMESNPVVREYRDLTRLSRRLESLDASFGYIGDIDHFPPEINEPIQKVRANLPGKELSSAIKESEAAITNRLNYLNKTSPHEVLYVRTKAIDPSSYEISLLLAGIALVGLGAGYRVRGQSLLDRRMGQELDALDSGDDTGSSSN